MELLSAERLDDLLEVGLIDIGLDGLEKGLEIICSGVGLSSENQKGISSEVFHG